MASLREIFLEAAAISDPAERSAYLTKACAGNASLLRQVERLLSADEEAGEPKESPASKIPDDAAPGTAIGPYHLLEKIGEGGCGSVFRAKQTDPVQREVALKIIKLGMDTRQVVARFEAESQALARMDHPNIAQVHDAGATESGRPYFVMECVRGTRVTDYCLQNQLGLRERAHLLVQICHAVQHAHQKGIIHRDLKPSNILVETVDGKPFPKIIDFGIAKAIEGRLTEQTLVTMAEQFMGTPAYMSPEQATSADIDMDTRSDIYSLGVLLYELLAGRPPFDTQELLETGLETMREIIRHREPERPSTKLSKITLSNKAATPSTLPIPHAEIAKDLDWIAMKCLEKDRNRRYQTASALAEDLQRHLNDEPILARPPSRLYRLGKAVRRNKGTFAAAAAVAAALVAGTIVSLWQASVAKKSLHEQRLLAYHSDMSAVGDAIRNQNFAKAERKLDVHLPRPGEKDLRDFEWHHFHQIVHRDDGVTIGEHPGGARELHAAADGSFLTVAGNQIFQGLGGPLLLWESAADSSPEALLDLGAVTAAALSQDGRQIAIARGRDIEIRSRDNPDKITKRFAKWYLDGRFDSDVRLIAFCDSDHRIAVGSYRITRPPFQLLDIATDEVVPVTWRAPLLSASALAASEDGTRLAISNASKEVVIVNLTDRAEERRLPLSGLPVRHVTPLRFIDSDKILAAASDNGQLDLWDTASWDHVRTFKGHQVNVTAIAGSPDGRWLATAGNDQVINLWDVQSASPSPYRQLRGHREEVWGVTFTPDGQSLVSCGRGGKIRRWPLEAAPEDKTDWRLPEDTAGTFLFRETLMTISHTGIWKSFLTDKLFSSGVLDPFVPPAPFSDRLLVPLNDHRHWLSFPNPLIETKPGWGPPVRLLCEQPTTSGERQFDHVEGFPEMTKANSQNSSRSTESRFVLHGAKDEQAHLLIWDLEASRIEQLLPTQLGLPCSLAISQDTELIVLGSSDGRIEVIDLIRNVSNVFSLSELEFAEVLAVLPDKRFAVAGGQPGVLIKINLASGEVVESVPASMLGIHAMDLSPNGTRLATGDALGLVKLWHLDPLREVTTLGSHTGLVRELRFQADGKEIHSVDQFEWRVWRAESRELQSSPRN